MTAALTLDDITYSCAGLGMHRDRCSRPDTCRCTCHTEVMADADDTDDACTDLAGCTCHCNRTEAKP